MINTRNKKGSQSDGVKPVKRDAASIRDNSHCSIFDMRIIFMGHRNKALIDSGAKLGFQTLDQIRSCRYVFALNFKTTKEEIRRDF